jgi:hypothetical protein
LVFLRPKLKELQPSWRAMVSSQVPFELMWVTTSASSRPGRSTPRTYNKKLPIYTNVPSPRTLGSSILMKVPASVP